MPPYNKQEKKGISWQNELFRRCVYYIYNNTKAFDIKEIINDDGQKDVLLYMKTKYLRGNKEEFSIRFFKYIYRRSYNYVNNLFTWRKLCHCYSKRIIEHLRKLSKAADPAEACLNIYAPDTENRMNFYKNCGKAMVEMSEEDDEFKDLLSGYIENGVTIPKKIRLDILKKAFYLPIIEPVMENKFENMLKCNFHEIKREIQKFSGQSYNEYYDKYIPDPITSTIMSDDDEDSEDEDFLMEKIKTVTRNLKHEKKNLKLKYLEYQGKEFCENEIKPNLYNKSYYLDMPESIIPSTSGNISTFENYHQENSAINSQIRRTNNRYDDINLDEYHDFNNELNFDSGHIQRSDDDNQNINSLRSSESEEEKNKDEDSNDDDDETDTDGDKNDDDNQPDTDSDDNDDDDNDQNNKVVYKNLSNLRQNHVKVKNLVSNNRKSRQIEDQTDTDTDDNSDDQPDTDSDDNDDDDNDQNNKVVYKNLSNLRKNLLKVKNLVSHNRKSRQIEAQTDADTDDNSDNQPDTDSNDSDDDDNVQNNKVAYKNLSNLRKNHLKVKNLVSLNRNSWQIEDQTDTDTDDNRDNQPDTDSNDNDDVNNDLNNKNIHKNLSKKLPEVNKYLESLNTKTSLIDKDIDKEEISLSLKSNPPSSDRTEFLDLKNPEPNSNQSFEVQLETRTEMLSNIKKEDELTNKISEITINNTNSQNNQEVICNKQVNGNELIIKSPKINTIHSNYQNDQESNNQNIENIKNQSDSENIVGVKVKLESPLKNVLDNFSDGKLGEIKQKIPEFIKKEPTDSLNNDTTGLIPNSSIKNIELDNNIKNLNIKKEEDNMSNTLFINHLKNKKNYNLRNCKRILLMDPKEKNSPNYNDSGIAVKKIKKEKPDMAKELNSCISVYDETMESALSNPENTNKGLAIEINNEKENANALVSNNLENKLTYNLRNFKRKEQVSNVTDLLKRQIKRSKVNRTEKIRKKLKKFKIQGSKKSLILGSVNTEENVENNTTKKKSSSRSTNNALKTLNNNIRVRKCKIKN